MRKPRRGDEFELVPEGVDAKGELFGSVDGYRVRVRRGEPGARMTVRVRKRRRDDLWADVLTVLERGPGAAEPRCAQFGTCGGCRYQDMQYAVQLDVLHAALLRLLQPLPLEEVAVAPVRPSPRVWGYRNKMDFTFSNRRWVVETEPEGVASDFALGLHLSGRHQKVLDIASCDIAFDAVNGLLASAREIAQAQGMTPRDQQVHAGLLRHLVLRTGEASGDVMVHLVTASEDQGRSADDWVDPFAAALGARHPEVTTFVHTTTDRMSAVAQGDVERTVFGPGILRERLGDLDFEVSAASFFQTNTAQATALAEYVREVVRATPTAGLGRAPQSAFDVYCGGGMFALGMARDGLDVVGFELVESAVRDAERNAALNGIGGLRSSQATSPSS